MLILQICYLFALKLTNPHSVPSHNQISQQCGMLSPGLCELWGLRACGSEQEPLFQLLTRDRLLDQVNSLLFQMRSKVYCAVSAIILMPHC